jgi:hypothetical protein
MLKTKNEKFVDFLITAILVVFYYLLYLSQ